MSQCREGPPRRRREPDLRSPEPEWTGDTEDTGMRGGEGSGGKQRDVSGVGQDGQRVDGELCGDEDGRANRPGKRSQ